MSLVTHHISLLHRCIVWPGISVYVQTRNKCIISSTFAIISSIAYIPCRVLHYSLYHGTAPHPPLFQFTGTMDTNKEVKGMVREILDIIPLG